MAATPTALTDLRVAELSVLIGKKPANRRKMLIAKAEDGEPDAPGGHDDMAEKLTLELDAAAAAALKTAATPAAPEAEARIAEAIKAVGPERQPVVLLAARMLAGADTATLAAVAKAAGIEPPVKEVVKEVIREAAPGIPEEPVRKADGSYDLARVPEAQRPVAEALWKAHDRARVMEARLGEVVKASRVAALVAKARTDYGHLPGTTPEKLADMLAKAEDAKFGADMEALLKAANEAISKGALFAEVGTGGGTAAGGSAPIEKLEKMAADRAAKSAGKETPEQAFAALLGTPEGKALYDEHLTARYARA